MNLPEDCYFAYIVPGEAWYRDSVRDEQPSIQVMAAARGGGVAWEFIVEEHDLGGATLQLRMFGDAWDAFSQVPEFFAALREQEPSTLTVLRMLLDGLGAKDRTERERPRTVVTGLVGTCCAAEAALKAATHMVDSWLPDEEITRRVAHDVAVLDEAEAALPIETDQ